MEAKLKLFGIFCIMLVLVAGPIAAVNILGDFFVEINLVFYNAIGETWVSGVFKHYITYKIVGLILSGILSTTGIYLGKYIAKLLYAVTIIGVAGVINFIVILIIK